MTYYFETKGVLKAKTKRNGSVCEMSIPKYMPIGLKWVANRGFDPKIKSDYYSEDIPVIIRVTPEFGEITIINPAVKPEGFGEFCFLAQSVKRNNPVRDALEKYGNKPVMDAFRKRTDQDIRKNAEEKIEQRKTQLKNLNILKQELLQKVKLLENHEQELQEELKKAPRTQAQWKKYVAHQQKMSKFFRDGFTWEGKGVDLGTHVNTIDQVYAEAKELEKRKGYITTIGELRKQAAKEKKVQKQPIDPKTKTKNPVKKSKLTKKSTKKARK